MFPLIVECWPDQSCPTLLSQSMTHRKDGLPTIFTPIYLPATERSNRRPAFPQNVLDELETRREVMLGCDLVRVEKELIEYLHASSGDGSCRGVVWAGFGRVKVPPRYAGFGEEGEEDVG